MDGWKTILSFWDGPFSGAIWLVSGRVYHTWIPWDRNVTSLPPSQLLGAVSHWTTEAQWVRFEASFLVVTKHEWNPSLRENFLLDIKLFPWMSFIPWLKYSLIDPEKKTNALVNKNRSWEKVNQLEKHAHMWLLGTMVITTPRKKYYNRSFCSLKWENHIY